MTTNCQMEPIGAIVRSNDQILIQLKKCYAPALDGLDGFGHVLVVWYFDRIDCAIDRTNFDVRQPFKAAPDHAGVFATRSPHRPNPIALSVSEVIEVDHENASIRIASSEAFDGTPVLDIKPYIPHLDRVEHPIVPLWCSHWPESVEESPAFDWEKERR